ncbi:MULTISPECIES: class I SAM-dependent methyltransferase [unclassified Rhodococcus (in: high G+C Gram-positive bacteria)]|uniref:class I SAM-dependent methyltransferase n=1 Tax=unclassified Rhodococcus (in: high G+C Gram-positive bacteria) TaxID=192944 RepID=UPI001639E8F1|nr:MULTISPECIES: class I SAM-dependent methyltransferase [unclassified Rhodococcus (in: high G+C Gram-positive bacteria)]MBC2642295.1 class I SAM-dependent methyltransferase [Rhodococcus sp. 3A]MBC2892962.1 class I SAM-dependent methyltransferase [Rhodococcus sp. 4CII]
MDDTIDAVHADSELKNKHRAMWALGDYPALAIDIIADLGPALVRASHIRPGDRVLDVAAGSGNAAIPAALSGASVVAGDLTPELFDAGRRHAAEVGAHVEWRQADAEAMPFADDEFDTVMSCVGVMFAPHHQASADELVRVCRPGGTISLLSWTPEGFVGQMFATMKPYAPPPPPGAQPPPLWGREDHVRALFSHRVTDVVATRKTLRVDQFRSPEHFRDYFKTRYGPTIAVYRNIAGDPDRVAALDRELADLAHRYDYGHGSTVMNWEYLLLTARKW